MFRILRALRHDAAAAMRRPSMVFLLGRKDVRRRFYHLLKARIFQARLDSSWEAVNGESATGETSFQRRTYRSYDQYVEHQQLKGKYLNLADYDKTFRNALRERLEKMEIVSPGKTVVCLAARVGSEVKAFIDVGCFAVGIDLNPGEQNRYVLYGDFHDLQFPDDSADLVYTNSLDHAFNIEKIIDEVKRVLKPGGHLIVEALQGSEEGYSPSNFESFWWDGIGDLVALFEESQLELVDQSRFATPWNGVQLSLRVGNVRSNTLETSHART